MAIHNRILKLSMQKKSSDHKGERCSFAFISYPGQLQEFKHLMKVDGFETCRCINYIYDLRP